MSFQVEIQLKSPPARFIQSELSFLGALECPDSRDSWDIWSFQRSVLFVPSRGRGCRLWGTPTTSMNSTPIWDCCVPGYILGHSWRSTKQPTCLPSLFVKLLFVRRHRPLKLRVNERSPGRSGRPGQLGQPIGHQTMSRTSRPSMTMFHHDHVSYVPPELGDLHVLHHEFTRMIESGNTAQGVFGVKPSGANTQIDRRPLQREPGFGRSA